MHAVSDIFGTVGSSAADDDWQLIVDADRLREAFQHLRDHFREHSSLIPYTYSTRCRIPPYNMVSTGSGTIHGFRIGGQIHSLVAGYNKCLLKRCILRSDGSAEYVEEQDVKGLKYIDTDDWGRITITRRKSASDVEKWINTVARKLKRAKGELVVDCA